jgi:hypothetical protein
MDHTGCHMDYTGCHRLNRVLTHTDNVSEKCANPTLRYPGHVGYMVDLCDAIPAPKPRYILIEAMSSIRMPQAPVDFTAGGCTSVLFYYKHFLPPDAAWKQNELVLLNKRLERRAPCRTS